MRCLLPAFNRAVTLPGAGVAGFAQLPFHGNLRQLSPPPAELQRGRRLACFSTLSDLTIVPLLDCGIITRERFLRFAWDNVTNGE